MISTTKYSIAAAGSKPILHIGRSVVFNATLKTQYLIANYIDSVSSTPGNASVRFEKLRDELRIGRLVSFE